MGEDGGDSLERAILKRLRGAKRKHFLIDKLASITRADPTDVEAWNALGVAERGQGKFDAAQKAYEKALAADPNGPGAADALFNLAVLQMDFKKDPAKARARLDEYLKVAAPTHPRHADAEARARELAKQAPPPAQSTRPE